MPAGSYDSVTKVVEAVENIIGKSKYGGTGSRGRRVNAVQTFAICSASKWEN